MAKILDKMETPIEEIWNLDNKNYDKAVLLATLLQKYADLPVVENNPLMFKYFSDNFWRKYYRTFQKWFDAFDIPYNPLENYNQKAEELTKVKEHGNQYNSFNNKDEIETEHQGENTNATESSGNSNTNGSNRQVTNTVEDERKDTHNETDTTEDVTKDQDTTDTKTTESTRNIGVDEEYSESVNKNDTINGTVTEKSTSLSVNTSGRLIPQYDSEGHIIGYTVEPNSERSIENGVSAFDEGSEHIRPFSADNYAPANISYTNGSITDNGTDNKTTTTHQTEQEVTNKEGEKHTDTHDGFDENVNGSGTLDETINTIGKVESTGDETIHKTSETVTEGTEQSETATNGRINENGTNRATDTSKGTHTGNSQQVAHNKRDSLLERFIHGNIGVTTSQQMLTAEIRVQLFSIYDQIAELFVDENCIGIWLNDRQRRGFYW